MESVTVGYDYYQCVGSDYYQGVGGAYIHGVVCWNISIDTKDIRL